MNHAGGTAFEGSAIAPHSERAPPLATNEIHVWQLTLGAAQPVAQARAEVRATLLRLLSDYAGSPGAPRLATGAHGKPFAPDFPALEFNLSHSGAHALIAVARNQPLGVDIEARPRQVNVGELARRFFASSEADALAALEDTARDAAFLRLWTRKEAVMKALGSGLSFGLDRVEFRLGTDAQVHGLCHMAAESGAIEDWQIHGLDVGTGLHAALAWRGAARSVRRFRWPG